MLTLNTFKHYLKKSESLVCTQSAGVAPFAGLQKIVFTLIAERGPDVFWM